MIACRSLALHVHSCFIARGHCRCRSVARRDGVRRLRSKTPCDVAKDPGAFASAVEVGPTLSLLLSSQPRAAGPFPARRFVGLARLERRSLPVQKGRAGTPVPKTSTPEQPSQTPQVRERKAEATLKAAAVATAYTPPRRVSLYNLLEATPACFCALL